MPIALDHKVQSVNVLSIGVVQGQFVASGTAIDNRTILSTFLTDGVSLYFPAGYYELEGSGTELIGGINLDSVTIFGDGISSIIKSNSAGQRIFRFQNSKRISVTDLQIRGYSDSAPAELSSTLIGGVVFENCEDAVVQDCHITGIAGRGISLDGCLGGVVTGNVCWGNEGTDVIGGAGNFADEDIVIQDGGAVTRSRLITVANNHCLSNNHIGIACLPISTSLIISDNVVVSCDRNRVEVTTRAAIRRKEGIVAQYGTGGSVIGDNEHEMTVSGNVIRNTRWSGIYLNSNVYLDGNAGGIKGVISGNTIVNTCLDNTSGIDNWKRNSITVEQFRDVVITGNVCEWVSEGDPSQEPHAGIQVGLSSDTTPTPDPFSTQYDKPSRAVITSNNISNIRGKGIILTAEINEVIVGDNVVQETSDTMFEIRARVTPGTRTGDVSVCNNRFVSSQLLGTSNAVLLLGTFGECRFSHNTVESTGAGWATAGVYLLFINSPNVGFEFDSNTFIGNGSAFARGIRIDDIGPLGKNRSFRIRGNLLKDLALGIWDTGGTGVAADSAYFESDNRFENVTDAINNQSGRLYNGVFAGESNSIVTMPSNVATPAPPVGTMWVAGDRASNLAYTPGGVLGWEHDGTSWVGRSDQALNADMFGIPTDGTTDAAPAIQAMLDACVTLGIGHAILPPRTYRIATQINWPTGAAALQNRLLVLEGNGSVMLVSAGITAIDRAWPDANNTSTNWKAWRPMIRNLVFIGDDTTATAIKLRQVAGSEISNCDFQNLNAGIILVSGLWCTIARCNADSCLSPFQIIAGVDDGVLNATQTNSASNVCTLNQCRAAPTNVNAVSFTIKHAANLVMNSCSSEGSDCDSMVDIDDSTGGYVLGTNVTINDFWAEVTTSCNQMFQINGRGSIYEIKGLSISPTTPGLIIRAEGTQSSLFRFNRCSTAHNTSSVQWFNNAAANANRNNWLFESNILEGVGAAPGNDFDEPTIWDLLPTNIATLNTAYAIT